MTSESVIQRVLTMVGGRVPATKLVKLVYLVDYVHYQHFGETVTGFEYQWDHFGPNAVQHGIVSAAQRLAGKNLINYETAGNQYGSQYGGITKYFSAIPDAEIPTLDAAAEMVMSDVVSRYGKLSVKQITAVSKNTRPFKNASQYDMLSMEQSAPAVSAAPEDVKAYQADLAEHGVRTLEQVKRAYGLE